MYEQSKNFESFHIAGFKHWDGAFELPNLKVGQNHFVAAAGSHFG